jgi:hypothetical protein
MMLSHAKEIDAEFIRRDSLFDDFADDVGVRVGGVGVTLREITESVESELESSVHRAIAYSILSLSVRSSRIKTMR